MFARLFCWMIPIVLLVAGCNLPSRRSAPSTSMPNPGPAEGATPPAAPRQAFSTPELIDASRQRGEITAGQRWLYLAYAIYDYESLPAEYHSSLRWDATLYLRELKKTAASAESLCVLEPEVQAELRRLLPGSAECPP